MVCKLPSRAQASGVDVKAYLSAPVAALPLPRASSTQRTTSL